jgi:SAM-dependent methyltransferase
VAVALWMWTSSRIRRSDDVGRPAGVRWACASGKATLPLARRGFRITCVEPGSALAAEARRNLASFPEINVVQSTFEDIDPWGHDAFDLVFAAAAWHWLDPAVRYRRASELLRPGGHVAFWSASHVFPEGGDPFFTELQQVYDEIGEGLPEGATYFRPGELRDQREHIEASELFEPTLTATSGCSTPSPDTSRCSRGSAIACTRRFGAGWENVQTDCSAAAGAQSSTSLGDRTSHSRRRPMPLGSGG